jgi:ubiquinone/menaquinone biosynthesis C-methylase UbiE
MSLWRHFTDGIPEYLARHYWWAYLWRPAIWLFDHQPIINAILFGQYQRLLDTTLACLRDHPPKRLLQLTCVYGKLTPKLLAQLNPQPLHLADVAAAQLQLSRRKAGSHRSQLHLARMNAENLAYAGNSFDTVLIFFLMHEMPAEARQKTLREALRVLAPGGRLVVTEYGPLPRHHWLYRVWPSRWLLTYLEPFLDGFWREDLCADLAALGAPQGKAVQLAEDHRVFGGFYRVSVFALGDAAADSEHGAMGQA